MTLIACGQGHWSKISVWLYMPRRSILKEAKNIAQFKQGKDDGNLHFGKIKSEWKRYRGNGNK